MAKITNPTIANDTKEKWKHLFKIAHKDTRVTSMYATTTHVDAVSGIFIIEYEKAFIRKVGALKLIFK